MRAPVLFLALGALLGAARGASDEAPAAAPAPLRHLDVAELSAMQARLAALAQDVQRALATAPGSPAPAEAPPPKSKLEYLHDSLTVRLANVAYLGLRSHRCAGAAARRWRRTLYTTCATRRRRVATAARDAARATLLRV